SGGEKSVVNDTTSPVFGTDAASMAVPWSGQRGAGGTTSRSQRGQIDAGSVASITARPRAAAPSYWWRGRRSTAPVPPVRRLGAPPPGRGAASTAPPPARCPWRRGDDREP